MENQLSANDYLGRERIGKLMVKFSVPCVMALLVSSLYNIVDQIFIGRGVGYLGNGATNIVFPVTVVALALALLVGDSCAAYLSLCQGQNDAENAHKSVGNAVLLLAGGGILLAVLLAAFSEPLLWGFGATENNIGYAREYFAFIIPGIPFFVFGNGMNSIIRADGSPQFAMLSMLVGALINVIFDPIAIFVLGLGMRGAALATIAGQIVTAALAVFYMLHAKSFRLGKKSLRLRPRLIGRVLPLGVSSLLTQVSIVVITVVVNNVLIRYGAGTKYGSDIPLTVVGIVMKVFQIVIAIMVGISAGSQPIVGYNYGAGLHHRVKQIFRTMLGAEIVLGAVAMICFEVFPMQIIGIFGSESTLYNEFAVMAFRIYLSTILLCCVQKSISIFLQALGKPVLSAGLALLRDFVLLVPLTLLLPRAFGLIGTLYSAPVADILSILVAVVVMVKVWKRLGRTAEGTSPVETVPEKHAGKLQQEG